MEYVDVVWADEGRSSGILLLETLQDPDYPLDTYLHFDGKTFNTEKDFQDFIEELLVRVTGWHFIGTMTTMSALRKPLADSPCFTFKTGVAIVSLIVPNKSSQLEIERDNLILSVKKGNLNICMTQPVNKMKEIEFYAGFTK